MPELIRPYYLENRRNDFEHLEAEISILSPFLREKYRKLEITTSEAFIELYGKFLNDKQRSYFSESQMIFTDYETAEQFSRYWDVGIRSITNLKDASLGGFIYTGYTTSDNAQGHETRTTQGQSLEHYWAGRIVIFPLGEDEVHEVDTKWLMPNKEV